MPRRTRSAQTILVLLVVADVLCVLGAYASAFALRLAFPIPFTSHLLPVTRLQDMHHPIVVLLVSQVALLYFFGFYDLQRPQPRLRLAIRAVAALSIQLLAISAYYFFRGDLNLPRSVLVLLWLVNSSAVVAVRLWVRVRLGQMRPLSILLVGGADEVRTFLSTLSALRPFPELDIVGCVSLNGVTGVQGQSGIPWLGEAQQIGRAHV